jgi:hypothetical protein
MNKGEFNMTEHQLPIEEINGQNILTGIITHMLFTLDNQTPGDEGTDYKPLYCGLFNGITAIIREAATYEQVVAFLKQLQCEAEDAYIKSGG